MNIEQDINFELSRLRKTAWRMDALFYIPRTNITVGLDNVLGLVPVVGDIAALIPSVWMIKQAHRLGATPGTLVYMGLNTLADFVIGSIPIIGDIFDALYNANIRNYRALEVNLNKKAARAKEVRTASKDLGWANPNLLAD
ncbi:DUF4112 domain-containing protein [Yoonia sp. I 8.24]|uniref:DUF4112 domain-containing protein n=1 Tax=Yoonia sp. I 8.24 TaxID=1537229 RepID=UPI001EDCFCAA|nr:DUF4112 domain-containing protein [Yoonia sp. I 8.24]MCG3266298.1 DUF4112 domain-containing protein [Yoonia sp. I 8.24]